MRGSPHHYVRCAVILAALLVIQSASAASPEETSAARSAAQAGLEAYNRGSYLEALDRLQRAESLVHAPSHLLFLARSADKLGRLVHARETYIKLSREVLLADAPQAFRDAQEAAKTELVALEARIPSVTIELSAELSGADVSVDGVVLSKAIIGIPYPIDPGVHQFEAHRDGQVLSRAESTISEGTRASVLLTPSQLDIPPSAQRETGPTAGVSQPSEARRTSTAGSWHRAAGWTSVGAGAAVGVFGVVAYLRGGSKHSEADSLFDSCSPSCSPSEVRKGTNLDSTASKYGVAAAVGFAAGAAGLAGGAALLLLVPSQGAQTAIVPWFGPSSVGLTGSF